jgi:hypothetical protein
MVSKPEKEGPGLISLCFYTRLSGILKLYGKGQVGSLFSASRKCDSQISSLNTTFQTLINKKWENFSH